MEHKAQYVELKFNSKEKFEAWLKDKTKYKIELEDCGQDFLNFWVDEYGEILHTAPFQSWLWNGKMINTLSIKKGERLRFNDGNVLNYLTRKVEMQI